MKNNRIILLAATYSLVELAQALPYSCSETSFSESSLVKDRCFEMDFNFHKENRIKFANCPDNKICRLMSQEDKFEWPFNGA